MSGRTPIALLACHLGVAAGVCGLAVAARLGPVGTAVLLVGGLVPLLAGLPGLRAGSRYTHQWLAIAMVFYVGFGIAETVASLGSAVAANVLMLASGAELLLLLGVLKRGGPVSRESAES